MYITDNGLLETGYEDPMSGETGTFTYSFDIADIVPPEPWSGDNGEQVAYDAAGNEEERLTFYYRTRGPGQIKIGDCVYDMIPVQTYYVNDDETSLVELVYLMELGIPIAIGFGGTGYFDPFPPTGIGLAGG